MTEGSNTGIAGDRLKSFFERVENLEAEKKVIAEDIRDVKAEAKAEGFDMKAFNEVLKIRKMSSDERKERESMRDLYLQAIGLLD
jgi:uncharacterized protein (UPF0335 family)